MIKHELINLLKTFSRKELMWFGKFLDSPFFNNRGRLIKLFKVLKKFYPEFDSKNFTKHNVYNLIYGKIKYNDSTMRNLLSDLLKLALQYLKEEGLEKNDIESSFYLTQELFKREAFSLFRNKMSSNKKILESKHIFNSDYFFNNYKIGTDSFYVNLLTQKVLKKPYVESESEKLIEGIVSILTYFVMESIKHNNNLLEYSQTYNVKKNIETVSKFLEIFNFDKMISYVNENSKINIPVIEMYYNLLKTFTYFENENYYIDFKKSLIKCSKNLGINDNNFLHSRLIGYCISKINLGQHCSFDLNKELFDVLNIYTRNEYYKTESSKYLPFDLYRNVLINCINVKELSYMEEFIKTYSKKLLPKDVLSVENYSFALLNFEKKQFNKALTFINKIKFDEFVHKLDMKNLQLKINYELGHFESALSVIDTYKHFLKNNVLISESRKVLHNNFVNYTNKLIQYKNGSKKVNLSFISHKIESGKNIFDRVWLMDKVNEISF